MRNLGVDHNAAAIVRAVIGLCDALGMSTVAEGVKNADQLAMLEAQGRPRGRLLGANQQRKVA